MKLLTKTITLIGLLFAASAAWADNYTLDPNHTYVLWHASHFGFSSQTGKWPAEGSLVIDPANPQNSKVNVTIKMDQLATGLDEFNKHLKGTLFFDVAKYPTATFISNKVETTGDNTAKVTGTLTLHGVSKPVTLDVTLNKKGVSPITDKETLGFTAKTTIKRSDFDMKALLPGVSDDVAIDIQAEATKGDTAKAEPKKTDTTKP